MINLYINESTVSGVTVLDFKGRTRLGGATISLHKSIRCLVQEGKKSILLNLAGVAFIDSGGLGELIASRRTVHRNDGEISFLQPTDTLKELMTTARLFDLFEVYATESDAVAGLSGHKSKSLLAFV
jgi:anti-sigma B factor antagonist